MKGKILRGVVCGIFLVSSVSFSASKVGYVDLQKVFTGYKKAMESEASFKKEVEKEQIKINALQAEIKKMQAEYDKKKDILKPEEKKKKEEELKGKIQEFTKKWSEVNKKLDNRRKELEGKRIQEIKDAIKEYGKKHGYSVILDSRAILYGEDANDLTDEIIKLLNSKKMRIRCE